MIYNGFPIMIGDYDRSLLIDLNCFYSDGGCFCLCSCVHDWNCFVIMKCGCVCVFVCVCSMFLCFLCVYVMIC